MKPNLIDPRPRLCGCLTGSLLDRFQEMLQTSEVDMIELRLDTFYGNVSEETIANMLAQLAIRPRNPIIATNRPIRERGSFNGSEDARMEILAHCAQAGAEWVDLEESVPDSSLHLFRKLGVKIVLSHHNFTQTPDRRTLLSLLTDMASRNPDVIKLVTYAKTHEDNLKVLDLIPYGLNVLGIPIIAFCMGTFGRWSRFASLMLGSPWTYVQFSRGTPVAEGQLEAPVMRRILEYFSC